MAAELTQAKVDNLTATLRMANKTIDAALEMEELNDGEIPEEVRNLVAMYNDEEAMKEFYAAKDAAQLAAVLNAHKVPATEEDAAQLMEEMRNASQKLADSDGKLSEEELEEVSGGGFVDWCKKTWNKCTSTTLGKLLTGIVIGVVACAVIGAAVTLGAAAIAGATTVAIVGASFGYGAAGFVAATTAVTAGIGAFGGGVLGAIGGTIWGVVSA